MSNIKARLSLNTNETIAPIDNRIYGSFVEHLGRAIYTGVYQPEHPSADEQGFRTDVIDAVRELGVPVVRYPGGNFVSGYKWEDGIGPKDRRPIRTELAWFALESNQVGLDEFADWCKKTDSSLMMAVNLGTRGPQEAKDIVEYCNFPGGTTLSELRKANGHPEPHNVKLWCLGNEMDGEWQMGHKTAEEYGRTACEAAKLMKWVDPSIELVVCGSSGAGMKTFGSWERTVLRHTYPYVDYISLHSYYGNRDNDTPSFLASNLRMESFIREVAGISEEIGKELGIDKKVYLSFDEWNVWFHSSEHDKEVPKWMTVRPVLEDYYNFEDALVVGGILNTLINCADVVKVACLAQLINVIAPIMTEPDGGVWKQTIFYPFKYASKYGRGTALKVAADSPCYAAGDLAEIPYLDASAVLSEDGSYVTLFLVNRSLDSALELELDGISAVGLGEQMSYTYPDLKAGNSAAEPEKVIPQVAAIASLEAGKVKAVLPAASWNMVRVKL